MGDDHRLIRHAYGAQHGYMRMVDEAYAAWDALWRDLGEVLHVPTGVLALGEGGGGWLAESRSALRESGHNCESLSAAEVERRFPLLRTEGIADSFHCPAGGVLLGLLLDRRLNFVGDLILILCHAQNSCGREWRLLKKKQNGKGVLQHSSRSGGSSQDWGCAGFED